MAVEINYKKILDIHGMDIVNHIKENAEDIVYNMDYLITLEFSDVIDILERYPQIFICDKNEFKEKINNFVKQLGINYVELLENNTELWENLL